MSARSVSGSIRARVGEIRSDRDLDFKTVSGNIDLVLPATTNADLSLKSQFGEVDSDFDLQMRRTRFGESSRGQIGKGGPTLYASTLSGRIHLRKAP